MLVDLLYVQGKFGGKVVSRLNNEEEVNYWNFKGDILPFIHLDTIYFQTLNKFSDDLVHNGPNNLLCLLECIKRIVLLRVFN